jgi:hypothetical protein
LYYSSNITRKITLRVILAGHVVRVRNIRNTHNILVGKPQGKHRFGDLDVDGRIILKVDIKKYGVWM